MVARRIIAYESNRYADVYERHLAEMQECGFTAVCHTVPEIALEFDRPALEAMFRLTRDAGMEVWADPWCLGNLFGLGAYSGFIQKNPNARLMRPNGEYGPYACANNPQFASLVTDWLTFVSDAGATWVLWDEPNFARCYCERCADKRAPMLNALTAFTNRALHLGLNNSVCLHALAPHECLDVPLPHALACLPAVHDLGISTYLPYADPQLNEAPVRSYTRTWSTLAVDAARAADCSVHLWPQAYSLPAGKENLVRSVVEEAQSCGIEDFAIWSFRGSRGKQYQSARPDVVWSTVRSLFGTTPKTIPETRCVA